MDILENQSVPNYRNQLVDRMKSRFPDRTYDGPEGTEGLSDLAQSVMEALDDYDTQINEYNEQNNRLVDLFRTNPKAAAFLNAWVATKSPAAAFRKIYGADAFSAMSSPEGAQLIADIEAKELEDKAEQEKADGEKTSNFQQSIADLDAWGNERGLSDEEKVQVYDRFKKIVEDALNGIYSRDLFEMAWKSDHYNEDVEMARHEGEVAGRNANIKERQHRKNERMMAPPSLSGQGVPSGEPSPSQEKDNPWML